jgi:hypothetical protein
MKKIYKIFPIILMVFLVPTVFVNALQYGDGGVPIINNQADYEECVYSHPTDVGVCDDAYSVPLGDDPLDEGSGCNLRDTTFKQAVGCIISDVINPLIAVVVGIATLTFLWGLIKYLKGSTKSDERAQANSYMLYGILGLFIMVAFWGFVTLLLNVFFGGAVTQVPIPSIL